MDMDMDMDECREFNDNQSNQKQLNSLQSNDKPFKIAFYTHDTFGLGHVRRCLHMMRELSHRMPNAAILLVTGTPALQFFNDLPKNVDIVKVPTIVKTGEAESAPPHLPLDSREIVAMRSRIIRETVLAFSPDLFVVDNFPLGAKKELLPLLQDLAKMEPKTRTVVGLRDILDGPEVVQKDWRRNGIYEVLDNYYDKILIYGEQNIFDSIKEYGIPEHVAAKCHFCGYLTATDVVPDRRDEIRSEFGLIDQRPLILATGGGGGDAFPLLETFIESMKTLPNYTGLVFAGPMMGKGDRLALKNLASSVNNVIFRDFVSDLRPYLKAADLVVSMCGYNIASEVIQHQVRAVVVPRTWRFGEHAKRSDVSEEQEQIFRARMMAEAGLVGLIEPGMLTVETLAQAITSELNRSERGRSEFGRIESNCSEWGCSELGRSTLNRFELNHNLQSNLNFKITGLTQAVDILCDLLNLQKLKKP